MPKLCEFENCRNRATYGTLEKKRIFCLNHKLENMKSSFVCKCGKAIACFNYEGLSRKYCANCKKDGMIDVKNAKCVCGKAQPYFNFEGLPRKYCANCKKDGMTDVFSKKCLCGKAQPNYNYNGLPRKYCANCKKDGMINVVSKKCVCGKIPNFNYEELKIAEFCSTCKKDGMIDIKNAKCKCGKSLPTYNLEGLKPEFCSTCKKDGMINTKHPKCQNDGCFVIGNKKYKNYCTTCFQHLFPTDPLTFQIRSKTKEIAVRDFINSNYQGFNHDKVLQYGGCDCLHRRRIDHRKLIGNTLLCIETDENQHKMYSKEDELERYNDVMMAFTCKYIIIRFNPDSYLDSKGKKCNPQTGSRLDLLKKEMDKQLERIEKEDNKELLEIVYLFYDEKMN